MPDEATLSEAAVEARHAGYYADFLGNLSALFKTGGSELVGWDSAVDREMDNLHVAWRWFIRNEQPQRLLPAILALYLYQDFRGQVREGAQMAAALAECAARVPAGGSDDDEIRRRTQAMALMGQAAMGIRGGEITRGREQLEQAYVLLDGLDAPDERVALIGLLGPVAMMTMDRGTGQKAIEETLALADREDHVWGRALALNFLGLFHLTQGRMAKAKDTLIEAVDLWSEQPGLAWCRERSMVHLGLTHHALGEYEEALSIQEEALTLAREVRDYSFVPLSQCNLAYHHYARGELDLARDGFRDGLSEAQRFGLLNSVAHSIFGLGLASAAEGLASDAVTLLTFGFGLPGSYIGFLLGEPQRVLAELRTELSPDDFAAAVDRARKMELPDLMASGLLGAREEF
jgi:tetratricopeptide (TPR) repeat protein